VSAVTDVAIVANGGANIASLRFALDRLGISSHLTTDPAELRSASRVILPGVGAAGDAMQRLHALGLADVIPALTQPVLGICLGMQLLFAGSDEDDTSCLGIIPARVTRLPPRPGFPVPHMGWNQLHVRAESALTSGGAGDDYVYFVHSFAAPVGPWTLATTDYGGEFSALVQQRNFYGAQFHPERSSSPGARLLANFMRLESCS
jgi:imidazole glycerol-phosphate synthase subunit HisH